MAEQLSKDKVETLREMAANRGCRLVRSRRRKPGGDYGRFGLADARTGKEVFGFGKRGLQASADEIEDFLRGSAASTWKKSIGAAGKAAKAAKPAPAPARSRAAAAPKPSRPAKPPPHAHPGRAAEAKAPRATRPKAETRKPAEAAPPEPPPLRIRRGDSVDGEAVAALLAELGEKAEADAIADRIARFSRTGEPVLLAMLGEEVVGCVAWHAVPVLQSADPVGRITLLAVASGARRRGVGAELLRAAERKLAERGCWRVEMAVAGKSAAASKFCKAAGYDPAGDLFAKALEAGAK